MNIESVILGHLVFNEGYNRKVLPFLKEEYFKTSEERSTFNLVKTYVDKYNTTPTKEVLKLELQNLNTLSEAQFKETQDLIESLAIDNSKEEWLLDTTEKFCQERAIYNAIMESIGIMNGENKALDKGSIPKLLTDALAVSFDPNVGHDYLEDYEARYGFYQLTEEKVPFDLDYFNRITRGGLSRKSLNIAIAGTGVGKSLFMCHCAAAALSAGKNVLYITLEMSEEKIAERIDANLLNTDISEIADLSKEEFSKRVERIKAKTTGKLIIKEYPTTQAGTSHFRYLLNELRLKKNFVPDIIFVDYINICCSSRLKLGGNTNSYLYIKAIAEELRGLAIEFDLPIMTATQTNREGYGNSDVELTNTAESFGLPQTADLMFALITSEELEALSQVMVKQLKNRYNDLNMYKRFVIGVDRSRMRHYDVEQSAQEDIQDEASVFDKSTFGNREIEDHKPKLNGRKRKISDLVV